METGAVVVAAGMSSRMGDFKPMLSIGEISVAQRVVATLRQAGAERVVVVTGYNADELERHLSKSGAVFVRNEEYRTTEMFDSALIGLKYIRGKCDRILFTPVDVPLFTAATVRGLLDSGAELACPVCGGQRGHPILMSPDVVDRLLRQRRGRAEGRPQPLRCADDAGGRAGSGHTARRGHAGGLQTAA